MNPDILSDWGLDKYILLRDSLTCVYCGLDGKQSAAAFRQIARHFDHLVPRVRGGTDEMNNRVTCCQPCNWSKMDFDPSHPDDQVISNPDELREARIGRVVEKLKSQEWNWAYWNRAYDAIKQLI